MTQKDPLIEEWDDDPDLPQLEEIGVIESRETERAEKQAEARVVVEEILKELVLEAGRKAILESTWRMMREDPDKAQAAGGRQSHEPV